MSDLNAAFSVEWLDDAGNVLLSFNPRRADGIVVLNSRLDGEWGEELVVPAFPFEVEAEPDAAFRLVFDVLADRFSVYVDDAWLCDFQHRATPAAVLVRATTFIWRLEPAGSRSPARVDEPRGRAFVPEIVPGSLSGRSRSWAAPEVNPSSPEPLHSFRLFAALSTWMEEDVVEASVANCLRQGCERVYLLDNDSSDQTVERALAAGAILARRFGSERYDEPERMRQLGALVEEVSVGEGDEHIWWLYVDADEFHHGPCGLTLREYLATLDRRFRIVGARHFNHLPAGRPAHAEGRHPLDFQPLCYEIPELFCELGHSNHPLQRWDRQGPPIVSGLGAHDASCVDQLLEPTVATFFHHFPFRDEQQTRRRLASLFGQDTARSNRIGVNPDHEHLRLRRRSLDAVYRQRWHEVAFYPPCAPGYVPVLRRWEDSVRPRESQIARWYEDAALEPDIGEAEAARPARSTSVKPGAAAPTAHSSERAIILMYHRIAEPASDPFGLAVGPERFAEHLDVIHHLGSVRPLSELSPRSAGVRTPVTFALTFDDGYADNLHAAGPILERSGSPATVFVTTGCVGSASFWWDELTALLVENASFPERIALDGGGVAWGWSRADTERPSIWDLHAILMPLDDQSRRAALASLRSQLPDLRESPPCGRPLTFDELCALGKAELIDIGAHTQTHPMLAQLAAGQMTAEIVGSKRWLENVLSRPITMFAYPFGEPEQSDGLAVHIVGQAGFRLACSTVPAPVAQDSHPLHLPRLYVQNWDGHELERNISGLLGERGA